MARSKLTGREKVVFAPSVASLAAPTQAEINAGTALCTPGTNVVAGLVALQNFESKTGFISVPDAATDFDSQIVGRKSAGEPSLEFYDDDAGTSVPRTALAEGTAGYIIRMPYGQTTGKRAMVYPVTIGSLNDSQLTSAAEAAKFMVLVAITSTPNKNATIAA